MDVVANLIGILIILIMVVGARAKDAVQGAEAAEEKQQKIAIDVSVKDVDSAKSAEHQVEQDIHRIDQQLQQQKIEVAYRQGERDRAQLVITAAEESLSEQRAHLDESQRSEFDRRNELSAAASELGKLRKEIEFLESSAPQTAIIEHLPTPMAKTVFGKELHFRLRHGRLAYVPWDEFIQLLKEDAPQKLWRLKDQDEFTELLGPLGGFWMHYTMKRQTHAITTKIGVATQQTVVLDRFTLKPETEDLGEPLGEALRTGSQFQSLLANHRPGATTITVWTYPDSFREFRELKQALFRAGYVTAARPLPEDHPIGGSPNGSRSASE